MEITEDTDLSAVTVRYDKTVGDGIDDDLGQDSYDADAEALTPNTTTLLFSDNTSTSRKNTGSGSFYNSEYEGRVTHYGANGETAFGNITEGTALTLDEFKKQDIIDKYVFRAVKILNRIAGSERNS